MSSLPRAARLAVRSLLRTPGFAATSVVTLALGIGATATMFSALHSIVLRPLPLPEPERLVKLFGVTPMFEGMRLGLSLPEVADLPARCPSVEAASAFAIDSSNLTGSGEPQALTLGRVDSRFFDVLGLRPAAGRFLPAGESEAGADGVVVLSHALWTSRFGGDPGAVGRRIQLDGRPHRVVGVAPPSADRYPFPVDAWKPLVPTPAQRSDRGAHMYETLARLRPGRSSASAQTEASALARDLQAAFPATNKTWTLIVTPLQDEMVGAARPAFGALFAGVTLLLLIACVNVASLLVVRGLARRREMGIRAALGAGRALLVRDAAMESVVLALAGGVLGAIFAVWGVQGLRAVAPPDTPRLDQLRPDWLVVALATACASTVALLTGVLPALQALRVDVRTAVHAGHGARVSRGTRLTGLLSGAEVALAVPLLVCAGLTVKSLARLTNVDTGLRLERVLSLSVTLPAGRYGSAEARTRFLGQVTGALESLPGVRGVAASDTAVLQGNQNVYSGLRVRERDNPPDGYPNVEWLQVSPAYFATLGIPVRAGRVFSADDTLRSPRVVVVNELLGRLVWGESNPVGDHISIGFQDGEPVWAEVVGVAADTRDVAPAAPPRTEFYTPMLQRPTSAATFLVRTKAGAPDVAGRARAAVWSVDHDLPVEIKPLEAAVRVSRSAPSFRSVLFSAFALAALALAVLGVYGVAAYGVARRTCEVGLRMAVGAGRRRIVALILGSGMKPVALGLAIGGGGALALARGLSALLFDVQPTDPAVFVSALASLAVAALAACLLPALRAARVDPMTALRHE
jgi:putative ABC transport system permease protein